MKKFISAVSSLVIAATAMGGTFALTSNAATSNAVDKTIIEFQSNGKNAVTAKAGDTVTVDVYVPQSSGLQVIVGCLCINQNETLGQEGCAIENPDTGTVVTKLENARGNYGIKMKNADFANPGCFDSGWCKLSGKNAGDLSIESNGGFNSLYTNTWNMLYTATMAVGHTGGTVNIDAYAPFVKAGGTASSNKKWYNANYTAPVFEWDSSVEWAYEYKFFSFDLELPADLKDGTYVVDFLSPDTEYVSATSLFKSKSELTEKDMAKTQVLGVDADGKDIAVPFETKGLTITVGDPGPVTTTTPTTTTSKETTTTTINTTSGGSKVTTTTSTSTSSEEILDKNTIQYEFVSSEDNENVTFKDGKLYVGAGAEVTIDWIVKNDLGTAGMQYALDFSQIIKNGGSFDGWSDGDYKGTYQPGEAEVETTGRFELIYVNGNKEEKLADGSSVGHFDITAPEKEGTYTIGLWTAGDSKNQTVPFDQDKDAWKSALKTITIVVGNPPTTTSVSTTTTKPVTTTTITTVDGVSTTTTTNSTITSVSTTSTSSSVSTTTTTTTTSTEDTTPVTVNWGDVNCDGKVSIADAVLLNKAIAGGAKLTAQGEKNADVVNDGKIDKKDSKLLKQYIAEIVDKDALGKK